MIIKYAKKQIQVLKHIASGPTLKMSSTERKNACYDNISYVAMQSVLACVGL